VRFASLGSGSRGNALVVEAGGTRVLLDCGFGPRELARRLGRFGLSAEDLNAVIITHEHTDHVAGAARCATRHDLPLYLTHGTLNAAQFEGARVEVIDGHRPFAVGELEFHPFPVPHDAREPIQFVVSDGCFRCGILTDAGFATPHMVEMLSGCHALVLECNHDEDMLAGGSYPPALKRRIAGRNGHLSNFEAANLLRLLDTSRIQHVVAAHLSQQNNLPVLAQAALATALGCDPVWIGVADQENGFAWRGFA
jgi:phosphoribosyl 1,2-cyclic phosphodiesterase